MHLGVIEKRDNPRASFWRDGVLLVENSRGSGNANFDPGQLQLGGYRTNAEMSACEVSEVMLLIES